MSKKWETKAQLRYERDEARKTICWDYSIEYKDGSMEAAIEYAKNRGWDCFKGADDGSR